MKIKFKTLKELIEHPSFVGYCSDDQVFYWRLPKFPTSPEEYDLEILGKEIDISEFDMSNIFYDSNIRYFHTDTIYDIDVLSEFSDFDESNFDSICDTDGESYNVIDEGDIIRIGCRSFDKSEMKKVVNILLAKLGYNTI